MKKIRSLIVVLTFTCTSAFAYTASPMKPRPNTCTQVIRVALGTLSLASASVAVLCASSIPGNMGKGRDYVGNPMLLTLGFGVSVFSVISLLSGSLVKTMS